MTEPKRSGRQENWVRTALRLPPEIHAKVHEQAEKNRRSFNGEIVAVLEDATGRGDDLKEAA
jgi:hypothetical protein